MKISPKLKKISSISLMVVGGLALTLILCIGGKYLYLNTTSWYSTDSGYMGEEYGGFGLEKNSFDEFSLGDSPTPTSIESYESSLETEDSSEGKIMKNGSVDLKVEDLDGSYDNIYSILKNYNGELTSSYENGEGNNRYVSMTLKVESKYFEDIYAEIKDVEGEVIYASYYTNDVTSEYTDLESRLRNLEAAETQLVTLLTSADDVTETLAVYKELTTIRSQIEVIKGQLKYMDSQVDYSYITVTLSLSESGMSVVDDSWKPVGVIKNALASLLSFGKGIVNMLIWVVVFSPLVGIAVGIVILVKRKKGKK